MQAMFRLCSTLLAVSAALLATACGGSSGGSAPAGTTAPATEMTVALDWYPNPDHVGLFSAMDEGLFAKRGLVVKTEEPSDVSDPIKLVAAGRADVGISYEPELFFAQQQDTPVVAVAALVPRALNSIIANADDGIETVDDLKGKTIGEDGSKSTAAYLDTVLEHAGLDPDADVHRVNVGFNLVRALLAGKVDAVIGAFQNIEGAQLKAEGMNTVTFPVDRYGVPSYDELVLVANRDELQSDTDYRSAVGRFVAGLAAGTSWARSHEDQAIDVMQHHAASDYTKVLDRSVPATLALLDTTTLDPSAWTAFGNWMHAHGLLDQPPDGAALVASP
jgi:putative hydroxymethylpyrimidine transport system substrate-binding protein